MKNTDELADLMLELLEGNHNSEMPFVRQKLNEEDATE